MPAPVRGVAVPLHTASPTGTTAGIRWPGVGRSGTGVGGPGSVRSWRSVAYRGSVTLVDGFIDDTEVSSLVPSSMSPTSGQSFGVSPRLWGGLMSGGVEAPGYRRVVRPLCRSTGPSPPPRPIGAGELLAERTKGERSAREHPWEKWAQQVRRNTDWFDRRTIGHGERPCPVNQWWRTALDSSERRPPIWERMGVLRSPRDVTVRVPVTAVTSHDGRESMEQDPVWTVRASV